MQRNKYLSRGRLYEKQEPTKEAKKIYIFCEGNTTEYDYFIYFREMSSNLDIIPLKNIENQSDPNKLQKHAELKFCGNETQNAECTLLNGDEVWFAIDTDEWNKGKHSKIQELKDFCLSECAKNPEIKWQVAQSNPSFEIWFYYHFYNQKCDEIFVKTFPHFKGFINKSINNGGGFNTKKYSVELETAILNTENNFELNPENNQPTLYSTEVYLLGKVIFSFVKEKLEQAKKKMEEQSQLPD